MSEITVISGEIFRDKRGTIASLNDFRFDGIARFYFVHHPDTTIVRGWHGHRYERKWFFCVKGSFTLALVRPDDWRNPSPKLSAEIFGLTSVKSEIICVPAGYANGIKAGEPDSILLVLSDKTFPEALSDSWRYEKNLWVDWNKY